MHNYILLSKKLHQLGHLEMAALVDDLVGTKTATEKVLRDFHMHPKNIKIEKLPILFHMRACENPKWKSLEVIDIMFPMQSVLYPRIPSVDAAREDSTTPRVSLARTIEGAAGSLGLDRISKLYIAIYATIEPTEIVVPFSDEVASRPSDNRFYVHDAGKWGEVWSLRPVRVERMSIIAPGEKIY